MPATILQFVQAKVGDPPLPQTITLTNPVTAGSTLLMFFLDIVSNGVPLTFGDNLGNSWWNSFIPVQGSFVYHALNCAAGPTTITISNFGGHSGGWAIVVEVAGIEPVNALDIVSVYPTIPNEISINTNNSADVIFAYFVGTSTTPSTTAITVGPESTLISTWDTSSGPSTTTTMLVEYQTANSAGTYNSTVIPALTGTSSGVALVFKLQTTPPRPVSIVKQTVQQGVGGGFPTNSIPLPNPVTSGSVLLAFFEDLDPADVVTISDNIPNTWQNAFSSLGSTRGPYYAENCAAGPTTITFTGANNGGWVIVLEVSGPTTVNSLDAISGFPVSANTIPVTTTNPNDVIFAYFLGVGGPGTSVIAVGPESTLDSTLNVGSNVQGTEALLVEHQIVSSSGTYDSTVVPSLTGTGAGVAMAFKLAPSTPGNIVIKKATLPSGSGQAFTFTPSYGAPFILTDGESNDSGPLQPGTYSVAETPVAGWVTTTDSDPTSIVVTAGQTTTVTFTNTQDGRIVVAKTAVPSDTGQSFTFTPSYNNGTPFVLSNGQTNDSGYLVPGTYSVLETAVANWMTTTSQDPTAIVLAPGKVVTLTFTNTYKPVTVADVEELPVQDSLALDSNVPAWEATMGTPYTADESLPPVPAMNLSFQPADIGQVDLIYTPVPNQLSNTGVPLSFPPDFAPAIIYRALELLFSLQGEGADDQRARFCGSQYRLLVQLAKAMCFYPNMAGLPKMK